LLSLYLAFFLSFLHVRPSWTQYKCRVTKTCSFKRRNMLLRC